MVDDCVFSYQSTFPLNLACLAGTYRSLMDPQDQCLNCPMNTIMEMVAAPICLCIDGYFRDTNEGPGFACTCEL